MAQIPPIDDAYINEIIKSNGPYNPQLLTTQGVKLRELIKLFRDRMEQGDTGVVHTTGDESISGTKTFTLIKAEGISVNNLDNPSLNTVISPLDGVQTKYLSLTDGTFGVQLSSSVLEASRSQLLPDKDGIIALTSDLAAFATLSQLDTGLDSKIDDSQRGVSGGIPTLDGGGKIPASQLPNSVMELQGQWNAATNIPTLANNTGNPGDVYEVTAAGTQNLGSEDITFSVGDFVIYGADGTWFKSVNSNEVTSVFGRTGTLTAQQGDYSAFYPLLTESYSNPSWITSLAYSKLTGAPNLSNFAQSLNTIGTSGPATLVGGVLNIPDYSAGSGGGTVTSVTSSDSNITISDENTTPVLTLSNNITSNAASATLWGGEEADFQIGNLTNLGYLIGHSTTSDKIGPFSKATVQSYLNVDNGATLNNNISGNAGTVTNGVYTTGSYANPSWITSLAYSKITGAPSFVPYTGATTNVNLGSNSITSNSFIKSGGTSSQFLKADGSVDSNTYASSVTLENYLPLTGGTLTNDLFGTTIWSNQMISPLYTTGGGTSFDDAGITFNNSSDITISTGNNLIYDVPFGSIIHNALAGCVFNNGQVSTRAGLSIEDSTGESGLVINTTNNGTTPIFQFYTTTNFQGTSSISLELMADCTNPMLDVWNFTGTVKSTGFRLNFLQTAPTSATDTGIAGEIRYTSDYIYLCTATDTWKRAALSTW